MKMRSTRFAFVLLALSPGLTGCSGSGSAPTPVAAPSVLPSVSQPPTRLQPTVIAISPNEGSTAGEAWGTITGGQFQSGAVVRLGNDGVQAFVHNDTTIWVWTKSHPAGTVDVVVTNPGGLSGQLAGAYRFEPPGSFDPNADWVAYAGDDYGTDMRMVISNNALVSFACGASEVVTVWPPVPVRNGEFSFRGDGTVTISGHMVSPIGAVGTINVPGCIGADWWAVKDRSQIFMPAVRSDRAR